MQRRPRSVLWVLASCVALGALPGLIELAFQGASLRRFAYEALYGFVYASSVSVPGWLVIPRVMCFLREKPLKWQAGIVIALLGVFSVSGCLAANLILLALHMIAPGNFAATLWRTQKICLMITLSFGLLALVIAVLRERLEFAREELHGREMAEERERKIAAEARFASLESRVHPHFLFNTLNSISALVREDPAEAERMIERLSALLRFSLDSERTGVVPLREELKVVRDYLEIEKVRFGARLRYRIEATEAASEQMLPALSIQTLAENSVKFAVGARREGAAIVISAEVRDGRLRVEVSDDGPGFEPSASLKPGHGLDLLERRLSSLFGASASLEMSASEGRTLVAISVAA